MRLDDLVNEALAKIESMSADEFASECQKAGYTPIPKSQISMNQPVFGSAEAIVGAITYRHNIVLDGKGDHQDFSADSSEKSTFPVAA